MITIEFEDNGQDFLEWDIDSAGVVIACRPLQGWLWVGRQTIGTPKIGERIAIGSDGNASWIRYPVIRIEALQA
jgi:hypothetical protein